MDSLKNEGRPEIIDTYGYKFKPGKYHMMPDELDPLKHKYDIVGSEALTVLDQMFPPPPPRAGWYAKSTGEDPQPDRDTYALLRDNYTKDTKLEALWDEINTVPDWVDWDQIKRGQDVFYRYAPACVAGFAFQGLVASTGSSYRPAETLVRTGGHSVKLAKNRLFETFQLLLQITKGLEEVKPDGAGFASAIRVRLLHASVRNRILKLNSQRPGYFNEEKFGVPINELDSMQSVCAFSTNLVWLALPRQGIHVRNQEALDYLALWRWVGYIMGTPYYVLETPEKAFGAMESMLNACMRPTNNSRLLAKNLVAALDEVPPLYVSKEFFEAGTRYINGDALCDDIGIGKPGMYWKAVVVGQTWLLKAVVYTTRAVPSWDRWMIETFRNLFWGYVVESKDGLKGGYQYEFKYVPQLDQTTSLEKSDSEGKPVLGTSAIEKIGLVSFTLGVVLAAFIMSISTGLLLKTLPHFGELRSAMNVI